MKIIKLAENKRASIIQHATKSLKTGGIVIYPTETCYGVGVDATNQEAINKLFAYKSRREGKPLSIAVDSIEMARKYVEINEVAENLYANYLPGPITVVSKSKGTVAKGVASEANTIGVRIPDYPLILEIVKKFGKPITATSANMSYKPRPYSIAQLLENLPKKQQALIDLVIDAGTLEPNDPSTVVDTTLNNLNIMRQGVIQLEQAVKKADQLLSANTSNPEETVSFGSLNMLKLIDEPIKRPVLFLLNGELGAGKTQFAKGVARQLGIKSQIKSPSYNLINEYDYSRGNFSQGKFVHIDLWRVEIDDAVAQIGIEPYLVKGNVILIEWADKFANYILKLAKKHNCRTINVKFEYTGEGSREIASYLL